MNPAPQTPGEGETRGAALVGALRQAGLLLLAACLPAFAAATLTRPQWRDDLVAEGEIAVATALRQQPAPLWIDARPAAAFTAQHVPGALPLNLDSWDALLPGVLQRWEPGQAAIVYCSSRACQTSRDVAKRLEEIRIGPVYVLKGGWQAWKQK